MSDISETDVQAVRLDRSGYDDRGCHWGVGEPLWLVTLYEGRVSHRCYARAMTRAKAALAALYHREKHR